MKKILLSFALVFMFISCSDDNQVKSPSVEASTTSEATMAKTETNQEVLDAGLEIAIRYARDNDSPTTEELTAARACIISAVGGVPSSPGSTYYTVCVSIGKKWYTVDLQYDGGSLTASTVSSGGCSC